MNYVHGIFSFTPLCSPFYLLGTLLAVTGSVHLLPRLLVNWLPHFLTWLIYPPTQNPDPPGFSRSKYTPIRTTLRTQPISLRTLLLNITYLDHPNCHLEYPTFISHWISSMPPFYHIEFWTHRLFVFLNTTSVVLLSCYSQVTYVLRTIKTPHFEMSYLIFSTYTLICNEISSLL